MRARTAVSFLLLPAAMAVGARGSRAGGAPDVPALAAQLRALYEGPGRPGERWGRRPRLVTLANGTEVPREEAYRDDPRFVEAAAWLLDTARDDDAALGAWLLAGTPPARAAEAERVLRRSLGHRDPLAVLEAARSLSTLGGPEALPLLRTLAERADGEAVRAAAAWAAEQVARRVAAAAGPRPAPRLAPGFHRGVCWWREGQDRDDGRASFAALRSLGVDSISIHTWEPLQRSPHEPGFAPASPRLTITNLPALTASAHQAGLRVMFKPHLEMSHPRSEGWHGDIEMRDEAGWRAWFANYEGYLLDHARRAQAAGVDAFCVGREIDRTVLKREGDWRRLIAQVRSVYKGPLTYSAHHDTFDALGFWDALDFVGVAAYFPLSQHADPAPAALDAGWSAALSRLEAVARRTGKPVLLTEVGYPAVGSAAREPWSETRGAAEPWLQARCYEAALRAAAGRPWLQGSYFWLWEGVSAPPFRDRSFTIKGKPAAFVMAAYYR